MSLGSFRIGYNFSHSPSSFSKLLKRYFVNGETPSFLLVITGDGDYANGPGACTLWSPPGNLNKAC